MKKIANADINNLFRKFEGDPGVYHEIQQNYADEKAQQSWPIVAAMEKERANAPVLKSVSRNRIAQEGGVARSAIPAFLAKLVPQTAAEQAIPSLLAAVAANTGSFAKHAGDRTQVASPVAKPTTSLFAQTPAAKVSAAPVVKPPVASPATMQHLANDKLQTVFSRLLKPDVEVTPAEPDHSLRGLLGFLKK
ncbi:MAG: hypothetical protein AUJ88_02080 [Gallionellaceae bacterium CG1_02_56_997]|nr:MAG: hypothetical protein AUJ88_02080 [Gallionellaceae bacterium CG1_02_56_997]PIV91960.1 MAG: hypothetical protein COW45_02410 [Gallionellales bacterium CG17_big_fil_post_rev_8_21_14_2_50_54_146]HCJ51625.1 hypothetical protein [Gallionella sp.]